MDGCNEYAIFFRIILPIMGPAMSSMAVLVGMGAWNNSCGDAGAEDDEAVHAAHRPKNAVHAYGNNYDLMITGSCFAVLPILLLYVFAQKFIIEA